jgi:uncharacterized delta-60 repeat protein
MGRMPLAGDMRWRIRTPVLGLVFAVVAVLGCCQLAVAAPGDRDRAFGEDGLIDVTPSRLDATFQYGGAVDVVVGPHDEIFVLIEGRHSCGESKYCDDLLVVKYGPDGQRDATFSPRFEPQAQYLTKPWMVLDRDGRLVIAAGGGNGVEVIRLNADGTRDLSFGVGGRVTFFTGSRAYVTDLEETPAGEPVLVASIERPRSQGSVPIVRDLATDLTIVRLRQNGDLDTRFGGSGIVTYDPGFVTYDPGGLYAVGRLAVVGDEIAMSLRAEKKLRLVRFGQDGNISATTRPRIAGSRDWSPGPILVSPRGGVWVTGWREDETAIARFGPRWRQTRSFGVKGSMEWSQYGTPLFDLAPAGRLVLGGTLVNPGQSKYSEFSRDGVIRLFSQGSVDRTFGGGHPVRLPALAVSNSARGFDVQSDGGVVVLLSASDGCFRFCGPDRYYLARIEGGTSSATCHGRRATIVGTPRGETIAGTSRDDVIAALGGNDLVFGRGGHDLICGGPGDDHLRGGQGRDRLFGGQGGDNLKSGRGQGHKHS